MPQRYVPGVRIEVQDSMQSGYRYVLEARTGRDFASGFEPHYTPQKMLALGVFEGCYLNDCRDEFPARWYRGARLSAIPNPQINCFGVKSRQPLQVWQQKGWIFGNDPRGWFQWYCRYYLGRRDPVVDAVQVRRWRGIARHAAQIRKHCRPGDLACRPRQRQALLQWSWDPFI